uniref:Tyrosine-protein phosphatase domain-containing protein n=1 Tax=Magallana gigas TaxID=29159 RepID=A0A8W8IE04_MAGGI
MEIDFPSVPPQEIVDWEYAMRREMQEIVPNLYLGPYATANKNKLGYLESIGITDIICVRHTAEANFIKPNFPEKIRYLVLNVADIYTENIIQYFPQVKAFIEDSFARNGKVLVHGNAGMSRRDAFVYVQQKRFCIHPNEGFVQQLHEYEPMYRAKLSFEHSYTPLESGMLKRKFTEDPEPSHDDSFVMLST